MHTHISVVALTTTFLGVVIIGTAWKMVAMHLIANRSEFWTPVGEAMLQQYG